LLAKPGPAWGAAVCLGNGSRLSTAAGGARCSINAWMNSDVLKAISSIEEAAWTRSRNPNAIWDEDEERLVSRRSPKSLFTPLTSRRKADHADGRLWVSDQLLHFSMAPILRRAMSEPQVATSFVVLAGDCIHIGTPHSQAALCAHSGRWSLTKLGGMGS
jgi:hypothetical protein